MSSARVSILVPCYQQAHFLPAALDSALAQTAGILCFVTAGIYPDETVRFYFAGIDQVRFRRPVVPGDQLLLKATLTRRIRTIWKFDTVALVDGQEACSAELMVMPG